MSGARARARSQGPIHGSISAHSPVWSRSSRGCGHLSDLPSPKKLAHPVRSRSRARRAVPAWGRPAMRGASRARWPHMLDLAPNRKGLAGADPGPPPTVNPGPRPHASPALGHELSACAHAGPPPEAATQRGAVRSARGEAAPQKLRPCRPERCRERGLDSPSAAWRRGAVVTEGSTPPPRPQNGRRAGSAPPPTPAPRQPRGDQRTRSFGLWLTGLKEQPAPRGRTSPILPDAPGSSHPRTAAGVRPALRRALRAPPRRVPQRALHCEE